MTAYQLTDFVVVLLRLLEARAGGYHGGVDFELSQGIKKCLDDVLSLQNVSKEHLQSINIHI